MDDVNEQRAQAVTDQLFGLRPDDTTPTADFTINLEYALIARVPENIAAAIHAVSEKLQARFPEQYYYQPGQYHLTVVPVPSATDPEQTIAAFEPILKGWQLPIQVRGVGANRLQVGAVLYPEDQTLVPQRNRLRAALGTPFQAYTVHIPVWEELLWVNFMRFTVKPKEELLEMLRAYAEEDFGSFVLKQYELWAISTKVLDPAASKYIHTFKA